MSIIHIQADTVHHSVGDYLNWLDTNYLRLILDNDTIIDKVSNYPILLPKNNTANMIVSI